MSPGPEPDSEPDPSRWAALRQDATAGLTTGVMLIPQAMAYAMLAGLPPVVGLYAATVPLIAYALLGSSRQLAVGPVAMDSLLVATFVSQLAEPGSPRFVALAVTLALMVGALQFVLGLVRLGYLVNFLSHPVISGFTSAAALIIATSQLQHLLGLPLARSRYVHEVWGEALSRAGEIQWAPLLVGLGAVALILALKRWRPAVPRALVAVGLGGVVVWGIGLEGRGVALVGEIPGALPRPQLPPLEVDVLQRLLPAAGVIALVAFLEAISVAKAVARRRGEEVAPNRELLGLGAANLAAGLFQGYPVTGGFSRTAVNDAAGARTKWAGVITAGVVALAILFLTPLLYYVPKTVLAAIILTAVLGLIDVSEVRRLWQVKKGDLALLVLTFAGTLALGIEQGIAVGVGASLLWLVVRTTQPHYAVLGRLPGSETFKNVANYPAAETFPGLLIVRVDAQLYFGNVSFLRDMLRQEEEQNGPLRAVVLDASGNNQLDSSADAALHELAADYAKRGIQLHLACVKRPVFTVMERSGLVDRLGQERFHFSVGDAVQAVLATTPPPADRSNACVSA